METITIYTCITWQSDRLLQPCEAPEDFRFICFVPAAIRESMQEQAGVWELRALPDNLEGDLRRQSRYPKFLPHDYLPDCRFSLWMDANIEISSPEFYDRLRELADSDVCFAAPRHPLRDDLYEEMEACLKVGRATLDDMKRVCDFLLSGNWGRHSGMTENCLIFRVHNNPAVVRADKAWNELFARYPYRDQLLLGPCLKDAGIVPGRLIDTDVRNSAYLKYHVHARRGGKLERWRREARGEADARRFHTYFTESMCSLDDGNGSLAIVIPAYRARFLRRTLESLAAQTSKDFKVYIGDDASPDDLQTICGEFSDRLDLHYVRFDENLGGHDLVAQWRRCTEFAKEEWIWLFSDDDLMEPGCVEAFHNAQKRGVNLFHFNVEVIDSEDRVIERSTFPPLMDEKAFLKGRMRKGLRSYVVEYVFRRRAFEICGGYVDFDLAWNADDALWLRLAGYGGIHSIDGPRVHWRRSDSNITSVRDAATVLRKTDASIEYIKWLRAYRGCRTRGTMRWFVTSLWHSRKALTDSQIRACLKSYASADGRPGIYVAGRLFLRFKAMTARLLRK